MEVVVHVRDHGMLLLGLPVLDFGEVGGCFHPGVVLRARDIRSPTSAIVIAAHHTATGSPFKMERTSSSETCGNES
jgi:hypothetical protein